MEFRSPFPDVTIPDAPLFDALFGGLSAEDLARTAIIDTVTAEELSYAELVSRIEAVAGALAARGIAPHDVVALHAPNSAAFAAAFHGILRAGATATTVNVLYTPADIEAQLRNSGAKLLLTVSPLLAAARAAAAAVGLADAEIIVLDGAEGFASLADLLGERRAAPEVSIDAATHLAVLPYSSGTTGVAKGVMLSHRNVVANVSQIAELTGVVPADRLLAILPFFHIYGMTILLNLAFVNRATLVTMPKFELGQFLATIERHRCTYLFIAPPIAVALAKHPAVDGADLSSVHSILSGAAPLDGAVADAVAARLGCRVTQGYGMTEMSPVSTLTPFGDDRLPSSSAGVVIPNMRCRLIDTATGASIPVPETGTSAPGELQCAGPNVMLGYLGNDAATREAFTADGFLRTGDIATVSANGGVQVVDRVKELIKYKGYQVAPAELEALLLTHPEIADAAVIGAHDADGEEIPKAFVVAQPGSSLSEEQVIAFVAERVSPHKKIRRVEFLDAIPKSSTGKIFRKDLRGREAAASR